MHATSSSRSPAAVLAGPPTRIVDVGHSRIATWSMGEGPDLVLVHGWPLHSATFRHVLPGLAEHFRCHVFDLPGTGRTAIGPHTQIGMSAHVHTTRTVVDVLAPGQYAMLGHDSGGAIARFVAAEHGARVRALVLGNTEIPGHRPWQVRAYAAIHGLPLGTALFLASLRLRLVRHSSLAFGGCFTDPAYADGEFGELFLAPLLRDPAVAAGQMRLLDGLEWRLLDRLADVHARISAPVQLVWGEADPFFPLARAKVLPGQFGGPAELRTIPGAKLFAHEDHPAAFLEHALPFLRVHAPAAARAAS